ncbi:oxidoreductase [Acetobacter oeni]|uniref:Oxidoreductase n=2 Tax=Acetobacter oeni TaxID=304077 RepID=A0A511XIP2_9PROT|nr:SDR family NAD(P)-dependent oxidoreductase [Acetobacter oeni]GBR02413.1 oxidoreductase [Acetobacter oeni LMG 21952]GEN62813.1 oxidoreductase [Acetobacter oeni]
MRTRRQPLRRARHILTRLTGSTRNRDSAPVPRKILITGASGGIGKALALRYAGPGKTLVLWGRNATRLEDAAAACRQRGARVHIRETDLANGHAALRAYREDDTATPFDTVILCAGLSDMKRMADKTERPETVLELGLVNYATPAALTMAAADRMQQRGGGSIALIGSAGANHDLPFAAGYGGSKAGLARFASSARIALAPLGVRLTLIAPGFVDTAMSRRIVGPTPFLITADAAASRIITALKRDLPEVVFPWPFLVLRLIDRLTPRPLREAVMRRISADQRPREH